MRLFLLAALLLTTIGIRAQSGAAQPAGAHSGAASKAPAPTFLKPGPIITGPTRSCLAQRRKVYGIQNEGPWLRWQPDGVIPWTEGGPHSGSGQEIACVLVIKMALHDGRPVHAIQLYRFYAKKDSRQAMIPDPWPDSSPPAPRAIAGRIIRVPPLLTRTSAPSITSNSESWLAGQQMPPLWECREHPFFPAFLPSMGTSPSITNRYRRCR